MRRRILTCLIGCGPLLFILSACSSAERIAGFLGLNQASQKPATGVDYATFARGMRPVPGNPDSHLCLARYYQDRGKHREALAEFEKTLAMDPGCAKALGAMGVSYDYLKEFQRASECYRAALRIDPNAAGVYNNMGQSLLLQGSYVSAVEAFKRAAALDGANPRIHNNLGRAHALAGRCDLAIAEFEQGGKGISAEAALSRVLREAEGQPPSKETTAAAEEDGAKGFAARVARRLQERSGGEASRETSTAATAPKTENVAAICVEVSNGNGINHLAENVGGYLRKKGFRVTRVTNAEKFDVAGTCIYYEKNHAQAANLLAGQIPVVSKIRAVPALDVSRVKLKLVLGADMVRYRKEFIGGRS